MAFKLVALDIDGTLLDSQGKLPLKHKAVIKQAMDAGIYVVLATGRYHMQTEWIINELDYRGILVSNDGAVTINAQTGKVISENSFPVNDVAQFIKACRERSLHCAVCTAFDYYVESVDEAHEEHYHRYGIRYTFHDDLLTLSDSVMKFTISEPEKIGGWQDTSLPENLRVKTDAPHFKEYVHSKASKTNALSQVLRSMSIEPAEMIAIGDFYNDVDMLEYAGIGIAMGNAPDEVKDLAYDVTRSNDEDGVYYALHKYLFS